MEVELEGRIMKVSAKEPKQGKSKEPKPKQVNTVLELDDVDPDTLAQLCENKGKAAKSLRAALEARHRVSAPCIAKPMQVGYFLGVRKKASLTSAGVTLRKVVVDARGEPAAKLFYTEPYSAELVSLQGDNLGMDMRLQVAQQQEDLPLGDEE